MKQQFAAKHPWTILAAGAAIQVLTGLPAAWGVFQKPVMEEYGLSEQGAGYAFALLIASFGVGCVLGGFLQDKKGPRCAALWGTALLCGGFFAGGSARQALCAIALYEGESVVERKIKLLLRCAVDDQHELALGRRCCEILDRLSESCAYRLLVYLCQLAAQRDAPVSTESIFHILKRAHELVRRFVKYHGALLAAQAFKVLTAAFVRGGQKALKAEPALSLIHI